MKPLVRFTEKAKLIVRGDDGQDYVVDNRATASVKVVLEINGTANTWVTFVPVRQLDTYGAQRAAGEAFATFIRNLEHDSETVDDQLSRPQ